MRRNVDLEADIPIDAAVMLDDWMRSNLSVSKSSLVLNLDIKGPQPDPLRLVLISPQSKRKLVFCCKIYCTI